MTTARLWFLLLKPVTSDIAGEDLSSVGMDLTAPTTLPACAHHIIDPHEAAQGSGR